jgi:UDP-N-acetylmuramoyl-tripeptide--D-alanyl-D-alanine ligase
MVRLVDIPVVEIRKRMARIKPASHRGEIVSLLDRKILIDETYNSNPKALLSSLKSLTKMNHQRRKVLILGEMRELGAFSSALHDEIGDFLVSWITQEKPLLKLITVQGAARRISDRVNRDCPHIETHHVDELKALIESLPKWLKPEDIVFLKGSRGVKLDSVLFGLR